MQSVSQSILKWVGQKNVSLVKSAFRNNWNRIRQFLLSVQRLSCKYGNLGVSEFVYVSLGKILDDNINAQLQNCVSVLNEKKKNIL